MLNDDYREMLQGLLDHRVGFLVAGAYAMSAHGYVRATGDIDTWIEPSPENAQLTYQALAEFGAPLAQITPQVLSEKGVVFQIGIAPRRIDIRTQIDGVDFGEAYASRTPILIGRMQVPFLSRKNLIANKEATGRERDRLDAQAFRNLSEE